MITMNTKNLLLLASLTLAMPLTAQTPQEDFKRDITLSGSNYVAYRGPQKQLTAAPKGYKPFYLSHYGRHGSRYMIGKQAYDVPYFSLLKAKQEGKLTAKGEETLAKVKMIREEAKGRDGELTPLGALQHQGITRRMMERFPEIFAGNTNIEARSTLVIRCILSMENGLQQMLRINPKLHIFHDASEHDMYYMNQGDRYLDSLKHSVGIKVAQQEFAQKHVSYSRVMQELFNDPAWVKQNINQSDLNRKLYEMASSIQGTELRGKVSLYDLFTEEELYQNWLNANIWWQMAYGNSPYTGNVQPYSQRNLLMDIIEKADSCIALPHPAFISSNIPFLAHRIRLRDTYTYLGGYFLNSSPLAFPSKNCNLRNMNTFLPSGMIVIACSINSFAYLYGGLVRISPSHISVVCKKSIPPSPYPLSIRSVLRTS